MKILDRYILKTFLLSLLISMAALIGIVLVLDLVLNVNKLFNLSATARTTGFWSIFAGLVNYYFYKMFDYFQWTVSPAILVAAAASLVRLNRSRELIGIKAAGVSLYRVMWPMIAVALVLDAFYIVNQELILPAISIQLARSPDDLEVKKEFAVDFIRDENNNIIYAPLYNPKAREMRAEAKIKDDGTPLYLARVRIFRRDSKFQPLGTVEAEKATWDPKAGGWRLTGGVRLPPLKEPMLLDRIPDAPEGDPVDFYSTNVGPPEIVRHRASDFYRYMAYGELRALADDPMRSNRQALQVTMHQHITGPIMNLLLLLLGLPFVAGRDDRNYFSSIGVAIGLVIGVYAINFAATAFGQQGHIGPLLAAWLPVFFVLPASVLSMEALRT
ncbi:MAG: LptF/LptG family permease [Planctomycetota bacterium]|nr:LptF/LptG family permease [Planctomycetota bacterium]